jgi:LacI family repressor for deo operon, udp, cdd, tsx, nupC, and nupG
VERPQHVVAGNWGLEGGARAMESVLASDHLPTAIFAEYDEMAFGAMLTLRRAGLSVPDDISVVGFDDHEMASVVDLTTVSQPVQEQGELAARMLVDGLAERALEPVDVVLPTRLVIRGSTAPPTVARGRDGRRRAGEPAGSGRTMPL